MSQKRFQNEVTIHEALKRLSDAFPHLGFAWDWLTTKLHTNKIEFTYRKFTAEAFFIDGTSRRPLKGECRMSEHDIANRALRDLDGDMRISVLDGHDSTKFDITVCVQWHDAYESPRLE